MNPQGIQMHSLGPKPMRSLNPATGDLLREIATDSPATVETKMAQSLHTFKSWRMVPPGDRSALLLRAAEVLERDEPELATLMTLEMGKPITAARQEVRKCAMTCRFYAQHGESFLRDEQVAIEGTRSFIRHQPLGPILAVMPWNFPFWQVFRFAAPALMAGNVGLLKHASNVPQCAIAIESVFLKAGFPPGAFQTLLIGSEAVAGIIGDRRIRAATLTGSLDAGSKVAALAGRHIKKTVLELGGSDPFIVMPGADLNRATATAVRARTLNNGQSCIAAKRFILHRDIAQPFQELFVSRMAALNMGDPMDPNTDIGPLATAAVRDDLDRQVRESAAMGARILLGGHVPSGPGWFYPPTVLSDIPPGSPAATEELFGPVAGLFTVNDIHQAIDLANDSEFGLGSSFWSNDADEQELFIERIEAGAAFVNGMVASDPRIPFGGIKLSGYGRELGCHGLREFLNLKTVCIHQPPP